MRIGIPKESLHKEMRVAITPDCIKNIKNLGFNVIVEQDAGKLASFKDNVFESKGAMIGDTIEVWKSDIILKINPPNDYEISLMSKNSLLISFIWIDENIKILEKLASKFITVIAMDAVPRISRAQSIDALTSMANISGYRAIIEAAYKFGRSFSGEITAAGKILPANVMVIGAGVAGLSAISTAFRLGSKVYAFDTRQEVKEQVESIGAKFLEIEFNKKTEITNKNIIFEDIIKSEVDLFSIQARKMDIIITTVLIPGKASPKLITKNIVYSMKSGSIIVDLAAKNGGNCDLTIADSIITTDNNVCIIGYTNLPSRLAIQASQFYGTNLLNLLNLLCKNKNGEIVINLDDFVICSMTVVYQGKLKLSKSQISINKIDIPNKQTREVSIKKIEKIYKNNFNNIKNNKYIFFIMVTLLIFLIITQVTQKEFFSHLMIFSLSCVVGYYVVWNVKYSLHTPLMSVSNAISGIIVIGALLQIKQGGWISFLSFLAIIIGSINIFGGFIITQRMLKMFRKR